MTKSITVSIPHRLSREEAKSRLETGITRLTTQFAGHNAHVVDKWTGNHLDFTVMAMGQSLTGRLDVEPECVKIDIDLPWLLAMIADKIKGRVESEGRKLLEKK